MSSTTTVKGTDAKVECIIPILNVRNFSASIDYEEYKASGAKIREQPVNYPWAYEFRVEDLDGHVIRIGSAPKEDEAHDH